MPSRRYNAFSDHLHAVFGAPARKVTFSAGLTCPNRDGTLDTGGCSYCSGLELVPGCRVHGEGVGAQIRRGIAAARRPAGTRFIAYLQDHTGTHCAPERLRLMLDEALSVEGVAGLSVGTRPDCLGPAIMDVLESFARRTAFWLEIGLQSASDRTLAAIGRNHTAADFAAAVTDARSRGIEAVAHVILGLPGEGTRETDATADFLSVCGVPGVKIHNLLVLRGTRLHHDFARGGFVPPTIEQYCDMAVRFLELLPPATVIHRLAAEAGPDLLIEPVWARDKSGVARAVVRELERRDTWQGARLADKNGAGEVGT